MNAPRNIPEIVRQRQNEASDPEISAFVAANAGSGKTHVLAQKVMRLLLADVEPGKILCLTFTKAAAANMANRVFNSLCRWTAFDDKALETAMRDIGIREIDAAQLAQARRLFAQALETPGGLKVQTIHAFCARLLHQFPFEANVAARFKVLDERMERELLERSGFSVLLEAAAAPQGSMGQALTIAISAAADATLQDVMREAIGRRVDLLQWVEQAGGFSAAIGQLSQTLGLAAGDTLASIETEIAEGPHTPSSQWIAIAGICAGGSANDQKQASRFEAAVAANGAARIDHYLSAFFTGVFEPRKSIVTGALAKQHPDIGQRLAAEQGRLLPLLDRRRAAVLRDRTAALLSIVLETTKRYQAEKDRRGLLDYQDLIEKTLSMLSRVAPSWVHYKLDMGIDHVLIDEAQDTSPEQWQIVTSLISEFAAGAGARSAIKRTVFAVGDEKQSVFSFQGAAPREFDRMRRQFERIFNNPENGWRFVHFDHSFRSGKNILGAVGEVFRSKDIFASITTDEAGMSPHEALPDASPGVVEIWEPVKPEDTREIEGWDAPFDALPQSSPQVILAGRVAQTIKRATAKGLPAGDVLVLVRQRGPIFEAIIRALKNAGVPVAGADRLTLTEHIAIEDLMALGDTALLPSDDLSLAIALKSPLFGFSEDELFDLAWNRSGTLRQSLREKHPDISAVLERLAVDARRDAPFAFYSRILNQDRGRRKIQSRLGVEANDALDEFLNAALVYESSEASSLQGFLAWMRAGETEIKRDMDIVRDEVRVMTVHGAKGLEAPLVILADTMTKPEGSHPPRLIPLKPDGHPQDAVFPIVWASSRIGDVPAVSRARDDANIAAEDEHRRLLYVAMTRAEEHLIVCGFDGMKARPDDCWYDLVRRALQDKLMEEQTEDGPVLRYRKDPAVRADTVAGQDARPKSAEIDLPTWLTQSVPGEAVRASAITPSGASEDGARYAASPSSFGRESALLRGVLVHRLMQSLPDIAPEFQDEAARRYLARAGKNLAEKDRTEIAAQVFAILGNSAFQPLFAQGSRAEVPIVGRLGKSLVSGQVDRLVVTDDAVLIADYKTNRPAPRNLDDALKAHRGYVRQLALYRAVLGRIYPGRPIRAALIWTDIAALMDIPAKALDHALDAESAMLTPA